MIDVLSNDFMKIAGIIDKNADVLAKQGADKVLELERKYVPIDTRALYDSIRIEQQADAEYDVIAGDLAADVDYADYVNYGTYNSPAQPFVEPAAAQTRWAWYDTVGLELLDG